jgi:hypothetical protein
LSGLFLLLSGLFLLLLLWLLLRRLGRPLVLGRRWLLWLDRWWLRKPWRWLLLRRLGRPLVLDRW